MSGETLVCPTRHYPGPAGTAAPEVKHLMPFQGPRGRHFAEGSGTISEAEETAHLVLPIFYCVF